jgi:hypothetical protein
VGAKDSRKWVRNSLERALHGKGAVEDPVLARSAGFENVSRSFGMVGSLPRSAVYSRLLEDVIKQERENPEATPPAAAIEIAYRLRSLPPGAVASHIKAFYAAVRTLPGRLADEILGGLEIGKVASRWQARCDAIVARVPKHAFDDWCEAHVDDATQIEIELADSLRIFGQVLVEGAPLASRQRRASMESLSSAGVSRG